ncbi:MAG: MFS transporter [Dehalococcoidia bacterium]|nr:MFS transporter [Dehalococcoidia bacterium]
MAFLFAWGVHQDEVNKWYALLFSFFLGLDLSINSPVRQSLVANVVPREDLPNAIALENAVGTLVRAVAPILGVALITPLGYSGNFFVQSVAYLLMFLVLIPMRTPYREGFAGDDSVVGNFMEGIRHIRTDVTLLLLIVLIIIPSIFVHSTQNLLVIFADDIFQGDEKLVLGLLLSFGVGSLIATFVMASLSRFQGRA